MATTFPGGVTGGTVGSTYMYQSPQDQAAAYNLQKQMEADEKKKWADAAAQNSARMSQAVDLIYKPSSGKRPEPTFTTGSTVARPEQFPTMPGLQSPVRRLIPCQQNCWLGEE
jgi:hypothetical protein